MTPPPPALDPRPPPVFIQLEEGARVRLYPAGLGRRLTARAVDGLCQVLLAGTCFLVLGWITQRVDPETQAETTLQITLLTVTSLAIIGSVAMLVMLMLWN